MQTLTARLRLYSLLPFKNRASDPRATVSINYKSTPEVRFGFPARENRRRRCQIPSQIPRSGSRTKRLQKRRRRLKHLSVKNQTEYLQKHIHTKNTGATITGFIWVFLFYKKSLPEKKTLPVLSAGRMALPQLWRHFFSSLFKHKISEIFSTILETFLKNRKSNRILIHHLVYSILHSKNWNTSHLKSVRTLTCSKYIRPLKLYQLLKYMISVYSV